MLRRIGRRFGVYRMLGVDSRLTALTEQVDMLKSSLEVTPEMIDEFFEWKANNPIPDNPLVTVAVATYNRAQLLTSRCIPSVLNQTYENLELVIVGDGCTDETEELMSGIIDPRVKFVNLAERGSYPESPSRRWLVAGTEPTNKALEMSGGYFVTHLDDDDEYLPERLEKLVAFSTKNDCDFVWHPFWWETSRGRWRRHEARAFAINEVTNLSVFYRSWFARIKSNSDSHRLGEPGDWNRYRRMKYMDPVCMRYPEPLSRHYREISQRR